MSDTPIKALTGTAQLQPLINSTSPYQGEELPQSLATLPVGSTVSGFVINRDRQNNPILRTQQGDVLVKSDIFLKTGSEVVIRIEATAARAHARIVRVDNQTIQELIQSQQKHLPLQDDEISQPSIVRGQTPPSSSALQNTATAKGDALLLRASLLQPAASDGSAQEELLGAVLKTSPEAARLLANGQSFVVKILSSELNIAPQSLSPQLSPATLPAAIGTVSVNASASSANSEATAPTPAATPNPATALPPTPGPAQAATSAQTAQLYQAYAQTSLLALGTPNSAPAAAPTSPSALLTPISPDAAAPLAPQPLAAPIPTATSPAPTPASAAPAAPAPATLPEQGSPPAPQAAPAATPVPSPAAAGTPEDEILSLLAGQPPAATATNASAAARPAAAPQLTLPNTLPLSLQLSGPPTASPPAVGTLTATVIGSEPDGTTILRSPIGTLKLFTTTPPPPGSSLQLQWVPESTATSHPTFFGIPLISKEAQAASLLDAASSTWEALRHAMTPISDSSASLLPSDVASRVPNTHSQFVNNALFFISALKTGDIRRWLGNALTDRIDEKSPALLQQLARDFSTLSQLHQHQDPNWQVMSFPLIHESELHQARLFIRRDEQEQKSQGGQSGLRFVLECSFSQLGQMQLDGLVRSAPIKQFDLIVRSMSALPKEMQKDIERIFKEAGAATGYAGNVLFQASPEHFVRPLQSAQAESSSGSILA